MRWDPLFDDLEGQLAAEWAAERDALDTEAERLRMSKMPLVDRLRALIGDDVRLDVDADGDALAGRLAAVGIDWLGLDADAGPVRGYLVPTARLVAVRAGESDLIRSARGVERGGGGLAARMPMGFVLRDLARRRVPVRIRVDGGRTLSGSIDRAGADHLDLAVHEPDEPRRRQAVRSFRLVPCAAVRWVAWEGPAAL